SKQKYPRPNIVLSRCLNREICRYDGQLIRDDFIDRLQDHVNFITVCPEVGIGLGTPRDSLVLVGNPDSPRLMQPTTGRNLTNDLQSFATGFLEQLGDVDGFILKQRSPSCGNRQVKIFRQIDDAEPAWYGNGLFTEIARNKYPHLPLIDEERLADSAHRHSFLAAIFTNAGRRLSEEINLSNDSRQAGIGLGVQLYPAVLQAQWRSEKSN
nr:DUF523 domain-containing protein [Candidatus Neomarinimicrobiota bacterium]